MRNFLIVVYLTGLFITPLLAQYTNIPDSNFEQALIDKGIDSQGILDGQILTSDANSTTGYLNISNENILDLTGIEAFTGITALNIQSNNLTTLSMPNLPQLNTLLAFDNQITDLDVSALDLIVLEISDNPLNNMLFGTQNNLTELWLQSAGLNAIDLSPFPSLDRLDLAYNNLTSIDLSYTTSLTKLFIRFNDFTSLDLSNTLQLETLDITSNNLTGIDFSPINTLISFNAVNNDLVSVNLSGQPNLISVNLLNNELIELNVKNGNNTNFVNFNALGNNNLMCIEVDDPNWSDINWSSNIDAGAYFDLDCPSFCTELTFPLDGTNDANPDSPIEWLAIPLVDGYRLTVGTCSGCSDIANALDVGNVTSYDFGLFNYLDTIYVTIEPYLGSTSGQGCSEESFSFGNGTINWTGTVFNPSNNAIWSTILLYDSDSHELIETFSTTAGISFNFDVPPGIYDIWATSNQFYTGATEIQAVDMTGDLAMDLTVYPVSTTNYFESTSWGELAVYGDESNTSYITAKVDPIYSVDSIYVGLYTKMSNPNEVNTKISEYGMTKGKFLMLDNGQGNDLIAGDGIFSSEDYRFDYTGNYQRDNALDLFVFTFYQIFENGNNNWIKDEQALTLGVINPNAIVHEPLTNITPEISINNYIIHYKDEYVCQEETVYEIFLDTFDFINKFYADVYLFASTHDMHKNEIEGIGYPIFNNNWATGSDGKLLGTNNFSRLLPYYPLNHETMHQWANGMLELFPALPGNLGHYGFSSVFGVVGGIGPTVTVVDANTVSFTTNKPSGSQGNFEIYSDLELYAMGVLEFNNLRSEFINVTNPSYIGNNEWNVSSISLVTPSDILNEYGPRIPSADTSVPEFRTATLVCSEKPLNNAAIDYFTYHAASWEGSISDQVLSFDECTGNNADMITLLPLAKYGCTNPLAHNFKDYADIDDGSCETCDDGVQNGDETDIDCGGELCAPCVVLGQDCPNLLNLSGIPITNGTYQAELDIISDNIISQNQTVHFKANNSVTLNSGFEISPGTIFRIIIDVCN